MSSPILSFSRKIVAPNVFLRASDTEMFESDPEEYIRRDIEGSGALLLVLLLLLLLLLLMLLLPLLLLFLFLFLFLSSLLLSSLFWLFLF